MYYSNPYTGGFLVRGDIIAKRRRNQVVSLFVALCYCVYALCLLDGSAEEEGYYPSFQSIAFQKAAVFAGTDSKEDYREEPLIKTNNDESNEENTVPINGDSDIIVPTPLPSHIKICSHLVPRLEHAHRKYKAEKTAQDLGIHNQGLNLESIPELNANVTEFENMDLIVVEEDKYVCEPKATVEALLGIYSSSLLSEAAARFQLKVMYKQACHIERFNQVKGDITVGHPFSIQEMLPADIFLNNIDFKDSIPFDILGIKTICRDCLKSSTKGTSHEDENSNCVLFNKPLSLQPPDDNPIPTGIEAIFPIMKANLKLIAERWEQDYQSKMFEKYRVQFHPSLNIPPPNPFVNSTSAENSTEEMITADGPKNEPKGRYVVYISCLEENCEGEQDSIAVPYRFYTDRVNKPDNVASVSIIVSESCAVTVDGCITYGQALHTIFIQRFAKAQVELIQSPSTYHIYSQFYLADYIFCPPNHACILPTMLSDGLAIVALDDKQLVSHWPKQLIKSSNTIFVNDFKGKSVRNLNHEFLVSKP